VELERPVHRAQFVGTVFKARFEQGGGVCREGDRALRVPGRPLHHAKGPRSPGQRQGLVGILGSGHRPVGSRHAKLGLRRPYDLVLH
jgi:hypothetical protein